MGNLATITSGSQLAQREVGDTARNLPRVLLVDDEPAVLAGLKRNLHKHFDLTLVEGGVAAVNLLSTSDELFAAIVCDMRMPDVDGLAVLAEYRELAPATTRLLLTGYADLEAAVAAVNEANVFRLLSKPCEPAALIRALDDAVRQHQLVQAEKELLEGTVRGSVQALFETLALANPAVFPRALRIKNLVGELLDAASIGNRWEVEVATIILQIGNITMPHDIAVRLNDGKVLDEDEQAIVDRAPELARNLVATIPRFENVRAIIGSLPDWRSRRAPVGTKIIRLAEHFDANEAYGLPRNVSLASFNEREGDYGSVALAALSAIRASDAPAD